MRTPSPDEIAQARLTYAGADGIVALLFPGYRWLLHATHDNCHIMEWFKTRWDHGCGEYDHAAGEALIALIDGIKRMGR